MRTPTIRISPQRAQVDTKLGFIHQLAGTWEGFGFNRAYPVNADTR